MALKDEAPKETLDTLGRVCPYPLLLTKKALEKLGSGQMLKVLCDAPASAEDSIPRYCLIGWWGGRTRTSSSPASSGCTS